VLPQRKTLHVLSGARSSQSNHIAASCRYGKHARGCMLMRHRALCRLASSQGGSAVDGVHSSRKYDPGPNRQVSANASGPQVLPASAVGGKYRLYLPAEFVASARLQPGTIQVLPVRPYQLVAANSHRAAVIRGCR